MDAQYRRGRGRGRGGGGGYYSSARGGPGHSMSQGRGTGYLRGRGTGNSTGQGRGRGYFGGRGRGTGYPTGQGRGGGYFRGQGRGNWKGQGREEIGSNGRDRDNSHSRGNQERYRKEKATNFEIPEDELDPLKLFVGNISKNLEEDHLHAYLSFYADITSVTIVKKKAKGLNYGFVSLPTVDDVKKVVDLNNQDCYISGVKLLFRPTRRRYIPPGQKGFVRQPLPDRDYDLSPPDPDKASIHILVDDVMMKILEYLPVSERIRCEVVCRRWQALLYVLFESSELTLSKEYIDTNNIYVNKAMLSKMLLLKGENLKTLSLYEASSDLQNKLFLMIAQLCPNLESLELSNNIDLDNMNPLKDCKSLRSFSAKKNFLFDEDCLKKLLSILPCLEYLDVSYTYIDGHCLNLLPQGLKHLNISWCKQISRQNLRKVSKVCKSLEALDIEYLEADKNFLEELASNCPDLKRLAFNYFLDEDDISEQVKAFTKLTTLRIRASTFELPKIADFVKNLEVLHIQIYNETTSVIDFGKFSQLKILCLFSSPFHKQEMISVEKCMHLQSLVIHDCKADQEVIRKIVKGCPEIKQIRAREVVADVNFIEDINEIMKKRSEPIRISVDRTLCSVPKYDEKKINFVFYEEASSDEDSCDDSDYDLFDSDIDDSDDYDSDVDLFWGLRGGYDSDDSGSGYMNNLDFLLLGLLKNM